MGTNLVLFAITNGQLQTEDFTLLAILGAAIAIIGAYVRKLHSDLRRTRQLLEEQSRLNSKLNETVERILKIDQDGAIDSNRRKRSKPPLN